MKPSKNDVQIKPQGVVVPFHVPTEAPNTTATIIDPESRRDEGEIENISTVFGELDI